MIEKYKERALELLNGEKEMPTGAAIGFVLCLPFVFLGKLLQIPTLLISIVIGWYYTNEEKK